MTRSSGWWKWQYPCRIRYRACVLVLLVVAIPCAGLSHWKEQQFPLNRVQQIPLHASADMSNASKADDTLPSFAGNFIARQLSSQLLQSTVREVELPLTNGTAEYEITFIFRPPTGTVIDDYDFVASVSNEDILTPDDVAISKVDAGNGVYNISAFFDFDKTVGVTEFHFDVVNTVNETTVAGPSIDFTVAGMAFYYTNQTHDRQLISTSKLPLTVFVPDLLNKPDANLEVFIQYMDGRNSSTSLDSLFPMEQISVQLQGIRKQLVYSKDTCSSVAGFYDGKDVLLPPSCGLGFSTNNLDGAYVGPWFGFDFQTNRNGSFVVVFEWDDLLVGSDYEDVGYETFIVVDILGETAPIITDIAPSGPFGSAGRDTVTFTLDNLPSDTLTAKKWDYNLSIFFDRDTAKEATLNDIVSNDDGSTSLIFTLPSGTGESLPWSLTISKPDGQVFEADDQSNLDYRFTFRNSVAILRISPNRGTQDGGTKVGLSGFFPKFNTFATNSYVTIGSSKIASDQILSASENEIFFLTPPSSSVSGGSSGASFNVTVTANGLTSNAVVYTYLNNVVISDMTPRSGPLKGGTRITLTGDFQTYLFNPTASIMFGDVAIGASMILRASETSIEFVTPAHKAIDPGNTTFRYPVAIKVDGKLSNSIDFLYEVPVVLSNMVPRSGPEAGSTLVTLTGSFINFDISSSAVYFDGSELDKSLIVSANKTHILFKTPPRDELGASTVYAVSVRIGALTSGSIEFTYEVTDFNLSIDPSGGTLNEETGIYEIGVCGNTLYRAVLPSGAQVQNVTYTWTVQDSVTGAEVLRGNALPTSLKTLYLPYDFFPTKGQTYLVSLTVTTAFKSFTATLPVTQSTAQKIGVKILPPPPVSPSNPNVTLTIQSDITIPRCNSNNSKTLSASITYVWRFRNETFVFSHLNTSVDQNQVGPTLLGREFKVPQAAMQYGTFPLALTAYYTSNTSVRGSDVAQVQIKPASLIAQINAGQVETKISDDRDISITGVFSRDPDVLVGDGSAGLQYSWSCRYGWDDALIDYIDCDSSLLPSKTAETFTVTSDALGDIRNSSSVYIQYRLAVRKRSLNVSGSEMQRVSKPVTSMFALSELEGVEYEPLVDIVLFDNLTSPIDLNSVKYFQDVIISPVSSSPATTWSYELLEPRSQSTLLLVSSNLIPYSGFWAVGSSAGRDLLGLIPNTLLPSTTYKFLIRSSRPGFEENEDILEFRTVQKPKLSLAPVSALSGDTNRTFIFSASTNYDGDFKFYFLLTDEFGFTSCVDGCQGTSVVRFRIAAPGVYSMACEVYDSLGFSQLAYVASSVNITVSSAIPQNQSLGIFNTDLSSSFVSGDHADFQQLGLDLVKYILSNNGSVSPEEDSEVLTNYTKYLGQIVSNSVPNSIQSAGYVKTAAALARLTPDVGIIYSSEALYSLVNITVNSVTRTPDTAALQQLDYLLDFYSQTPQIILAGSSEGSSRQRITQRVQSEELDEFAVLLVDMYEVMKEIIGVVALKPCSCGCILELSTSKISPSLEALNQRFQVSRQLAGRLKDNIRAGGDNQTTPAALYQNELDDVLTPVRFQVAHICNPEQGLELSLAIDGSEESNTFRWCNELFEDSFKDLYFLFIKTPNFVYVAGIRRNTTLTDGLASTVVAELADNNTLVNVVPPVSECFRLELAIPRSVGQSRNETPQLGDDDWEQQRPQACRLEPVKKWGVPVTDIGSYYNGIFPDQSKTNVTDSLVDRSLSIVSFTESVTGTFTVATKAAWDGGLFSIEGIFVSLAVSGLVTAIAVIIALASAAAFMIATHFAVREAGDAPVEGDFTYVERDVYGRGTAIDVPDYEQSPYE